MRQNLKNWLTMIAIAVAVELGSYLLQKSQTPITQKEAETVMALPAKQDGKTEDSGDRETENPEDVEIEDSKEEETDLPECVKRDCNCTDFSTQAEAL